MIHHDLIMSVLVLVLNVITVLVFSVNVAFRLRSAIRAVNRQQLDFYFMLIMISLIGVIMAGISFYIGIKIWLKTDYMVLESINHLRLIYAVLFCLIAGLVSLLDRRYNPFQIVNK